jgi:hypothetical protein
MGENRGAHVDIDQWSEQLRCPNCRNTGLAGLSQAENDDKSTVHSVPDGFKVVITEFGPDFICAACGIAVEP